VVDNHRMNWRLTITALCLASATLHAQAAPEILTAPLPRCVVDLECGAAVRAQGGTAPYKWRITRGALSPGLILDPASGRLSGVPRAPGEYEFTVEVTDSSQPPQNASHLFTQKVLNALTLDWKTPPTLQATTISGSLAVTNNSYETMDLTVIVVAVNEIGKAFALGYQHLSVAPDTKLSEIPFISQLPAGRYTVRADAIAEIVPRRKIFRAARQAGPFSVPAQ
jgi:hypothetical protein